MKIYAYDIECFSNFFSATFVNVEEPTETKVFYLASWGNKSPKELQEFLKQEMTLVGYNNDSYDNPMLRYLMQHGELGIIQDLHAFSSKLVDDNYRSDKAILALRYPREMKIAWNSIDLMRILAFDKLGISLKQCAINLKWHRIQDLPLHHTAEVEAEQLSLVLDYNMNDVLITKRLYEEIEPLRKLRTELSKIYGVDLTSASDSRVANLILQKIYTTEMKRDISEIRDLRTRRVKVLLGDCMAKFVKFETPALKAMYERISSTFVYEYNRYKYSETIDFAGCRFNLGVGGLHTEDAPGIFSSDEEYLIQDADVASYYPNSIINNGFYPQHLGPGFIQVLKKITAERIAAKKNGDKVKADGLKITINSIFGKLGSEDFWLLDAKQMLSTTVSGQMGLLMLVEKMHLAGIQVISCNTDGIVCRIKRTMMGEYNKVAEWWQKQTGLELEFTPYEKYVRRDVNSYVTLKEGGKTKEKGAFLKEVDLKKGYHMPIVAKALNAYFVNGTPVRKTLEDCKDIMEFCISQKSGGNFAIELRTINGTEKLQKTNRFFITKKGGSLIKRDQFSNKQTGLYVGRLVRILNDYDPSIPFEDYQVDFPFYEAEVMKIIDEIEPKQMKLFDMLGMDFGSKTKMDSGQAKESGPEEEPTDIFEISKLGSKQFIKRLSAIVEKGETIENVSPRFLYVMEWDGKKGTAKCYNLARGTTLTLPVNKKLLQEIPMKADSVIFCEKFGKSKDYPATIEEFYYTESLLSGDKTLINFPQIYP